MVTSESEVVSAYDAASAWEDHQAQHLNRQSPFAITTPCSEQHHARIIVYMHIGLYFYNTSMHYYY